MRNRRQEEAVEAWLRSKRRSIIHASPRMGKTRLGIEILNKLKARKVLIAYPNLPIKTSWEAEFQKISCDSEITYSTFLSLKNHIKETWDLVIVDEIHALSEAQIEALKGYKGNILGLSGTLSEETLNTLETELNLDVCFEYPIEQAVKEGVISDYEIEIHTVALDNKIQKVYNKKKSTKRTEKQQFDHLSRIIDWMDRSRKPTFMLRLQRMRLIQNSIAKLNKTKSLLNGRTLVFCGTTAIADQIGCSSYHSKAKEKNILDDFCQGSTNQLAVCKMLNMGVTIKGLDNVILNYTDSNEENLIQKICRCMNYDYVGKTAKIIIVSSTESVEINWIKSALKSLDQNKIQWK